MAKPKLRHLALFARDPEKLAQFYIDTLEMTIVPGSEGKERPGDRPFAEYRAIDPEGNWFDLSQHGFDTVETGEDRARESVSSR